MVLAADPKLGAGAQERPFFANLDALRGICALAVALYHMPWPSVFLTIAPIAQAWIFVDFFFVLSGFVIALSYWGRHGTPADVKRFIVKRFYRLYPLHIVFLVVMLVIEAGRFGVLPNLVNTALATEGRWTLYYWYQVALQALLLHATGIPSDAILNIPSWSISSEFWVYILFAAIGLTVTSTVIRTVVISFAAIAFTAVLYDRANGLYGPFEIGLLRCVAAFSTGCLTFFAYRAIAASGRAVPSSVSMIALLGLFALLWGLLAGPGVRTSENILALLIFALIIFFLALDRSSPLSRMLQRKPFVAAGTWSYSIYMIHAPITAVIGFAWNRVAPLMDVEDRLWAGSAVAVIYVVVVLFCSRLAFEFIERPWRDKGRDLATAHWPKSTAGRADAMPSPESRRDPQSEQQRTTC